MENQRSLNLGSKLLTRISVVIVVLVFLLPIASCVVSQFVTDMERNVTIDEYIEKYYSGRDIVISDKQSVVDSFSDEHEFYVAEIKDPVPIKFLIYPVTTHRDFSTYDDFVDTYADAVVFYLGKKYLAEEGIQFVAETDYDVIDSCLERITEKIVAALPEFGFRYGNGQSDNPQVIDDVSGFPVEVLSSDGATKICWPEYNSYAGKWNLFRDCNYNDFPWVVDSRLFGIRGMTYGDLPEPEVAKNELELKALADAEFGVSDKSLLE